MEQASSAEVAEASSESKSGLELTEAQESAESPGAAPSPVSGFGQRLPRFGAVVIGDEPAGLWLLAHLAGERPLGDAPLLWISFLEPGPVVVPFFWGPRWGLTVEGPWSAELRTPRRAFRWTERAVRERFPSLPSTVELKRPEERTDLGSTPAEKEVSRAVRELLDASPDFTLVSRLVARAAFRARRPGPEVAGVAALLWTELAWWRPAAAVPESVQRWTFGNFPTATAHVRSGDLHRLRFSNGAELESSLCVLNADERLLDRFFRGVGGLDAVLGYAAPRASIATVPVDVGVAERVLPRALSPLVVLADTEVFPDEDREVWTMSVNADMRCLRVDVATSPLVTDGSVGDAARLVLSRLRNVFPDFDRSVRSMSPTLSAEMCDEPEARRARIDDFECRLQGRYAAASFRREGTMTGIEPLLPSFRCDLPYPLGTLLAARDVLEKVSERRPRRRTTASTLPPEVGF